MFKCIGNPEAKILETKSNAIIANPKEYEVPNLLSNPKLKTEVHQRTKFFFESGIENNLKSEMIDFNSYLIDRILFFLHFFNTSEQRDNPAWTNIFGGE